MNVTLRGSWRWLREGGCGALECKERRRAVARKWELGRERVFAAWLFATFLDFHLSKYIFIITPWTAESPAPQRPFSARFLRSHYCISVVLIGTDYTSPRLLTPPRPPSFFESISAVRGSTELLPNRITKQKSHVSQRYHRYLVR